MTEANVIFILDGAKLAIQCTPIDKMKDMGIFGGYKFIPLSILSTLSLGDTIDMNNAMLLTLCKEGEDDIVRIIEQ